MQKNKTVTIPVSPQARPPVAASYDRLRKADTQFLPLIIVALMCLCVIALGAILPLQDLNFYQAFPTTSLESHLLSFSHLLFPHYSLTPALPVYHPHQPPASRAWTETGLFFASFLLLFLCYLLALRLLPSRIGPKTLFISTAVLGLLFAAYPVITSQDVFLYSIYARLAVVHHLNPLVASPSSARTDALYPFIYWTHDPSAYGPAWTLFTSFLQWIALLVTPTKSVTVVLLMRLSTLAVHLGSTAIIWCLTGMIGRRFASISPGRRIFATLAFAWNPLLLLESATNAHIDTFLLFFVLLAILALTSSPTQLRSILLASLFLALAAAMKITLVLLVPGLLLFLWLQRDRTHLLSRTLYTALLYGLVLALLYLPFWQHGAVLRAFQVTAGASRTVNGPYEFVVQLAVHLFAYPPFGHAPFDTAYNIKALGELVSHKVSTVLFAAGYLLVSIQSLRQRGHRPPLLVLITWMIEIWLLYCFIGSPWLWPWYFTIFFGLFALLEAAHRPEDTFMPFASAFARLLTIAALGIYLFSGLGPSDTYQTLPFLPLTYNYFRGLWLCLLPLFALYRYPWRQRHRQTQRLPFPSLPLVENQSLSND